MTRSNVEKLILCLLVVTGTCVFWPSRGTAQTQTRRPSPPQTRREPLSRANTPSPHGQKSTQNNNSNDTVTKTEMIITVAEDGRCTFKAIAINPLELFMGGHKYFNPCLPPTYSNPAGKICNYKSTSERRRNSCVTTIYAEYADIESLNRCFAVAGGYYYIIEESGVIRAGAKLRGSLKLSTVSRVTIKLPSINDYTNKNTAQLDEKNNQVTWTYNVQADKPINFDFEASGGFRVNARNLCNRNDDENAATSEAILHSQILVRDNVKHILEAAAEFDIDPKTIAGAIFSENARNLSPGELVFDAQLARLGFDVSVGVGQILVSTAKRVEDKGYMEKPKGFFPPTIGWSLERDARITILTDTRTNIRYIAAYMKYLSDLFPEIKDNSTILIHLYNIGEYPEGNPENGIRKIGDPPGYYCFAADAEAQYPYFEAVFRSYKKH